MTTFTPAQTANTGGSIFLLVALSFFWGTNWPFMKIALTEIPVWWFRTLCLFGGGLSLLAISYISGQRVRLQVWEIGPLLLCMTFGMLGWHLFSAYGVTIMPAGRASIIAFTMPVWAALLARVILGEPLTKLKIISLVLGLSGLAVLMGPDLIALEEAPLGAFLMLAASLSWGTGTVLFKKYNWSASTTALAGWQLTFAGIPIAIGAFLIQDPPEWNVISVKAYFSLAYVLILPMIFCQWAYLRSVRTFPASLAAISTLGVPVVGTYSSALILGEQLGFQELGALILVCMALATVLVVPNLSRGQGT